jgi:predicted secreted protein
MAQAAYKKQILVSSDNVTYTEVEATSVSLNQGTEVLDATTFASAEGWRSRVMGIIDWSISIEAIFTPGNTALSTIKTANTSRTTLYVRYLPDGTNANGFQGQVVVESFNMSGDVSGLETVSISMQGNGALGDVS